ncbi:hypothetical protein PspLS_08001 [Pyricularia sp. CBS 133598]|nr:hypothetical protein PspLS_08001 [Pyricularia sp. CBS 133598]
MTGDELSPAEAAMTQALTNSILAVLGISSITLSDDQVREVWAVLTATQREWTTAATRRHTDKLCAANEEIDSLSYILEEKRAAMSLLLCDVSRKQTWINTLEERVLDREAVVESQRRCIEEVESDVRDLSAACDAVVSRLLSLSARMVNDRPSKLLVEPGVVEELLGRLPVLGPPSDHTPYQVLEGVVLQRGFRILGCAVHARKSCNEIQAVWLATEKQGDEGSLLV